MPTPAPAPAPTPVPAQPTIVQLPGPGTTVGPQTIRVASPAPSVPHFPESVIRLPERDDHCTPMRSHTIRVGSPPVSHFPESVIRLPERDDCCTPMRSHTVRVGSPPVQPQSPSVITVSIAQDAPERVPISQLVRVGGVVPRPPVIPSAPPDTPPAEQIIRLPSTSVHQPSNAITCSSWRSACYRH
jgi:hypothetical protein